MSPFDGNQRECDKAVSIYSGALYQVTQCGLNEALHPLGKSNNSINQLGSPVKSGRPAPIWRFLLVTTRQLGEAGSVRGRNCPVHSSPATPPSPPATLPHTMAFCPHGPYSLGHGLNWVEAIAWEPHGSQHLPLATAVQGEPLGRAGVTSRASGLWKASTVLSLGLGDTGGGCLFPPVLRACGSAGGTQWCL